MIMLQRTLTARLLSSGCWIYLLMMTWKKVFSLLDYRALVLPREEQTGRSRVRETSALWGKKTNSIKSPEARPMEKPSLELHCINSNQQAELAYPIEETTSDLS